MEFIRKFCRNWIQDSNTAPILHLLFLFGWMNNIVQHEVTYTVKLWGITAYEEGWNRKVKNSCSESSRQDKYWRHIWQNLAARVVMSPLTDGTTDVNEDKCPD